MLVQAAGLAKKAWILGLLAGLLFGWSPQAAAQAGGDVFTIDRLAVDATGASAAEARDTAMSQGRVEALQRLFRRLTPQSYWGILPQISKADTISMVAGLQLANEKTSPTRYLADVTYSFKPARIREALRLAAVPFSETQARTAIVLTVLETPEGSFLWQADNPWAQAWQDRLLGNELVPFLLPLGELEDLVSVNVDDALAHNWGVLGPFAERYGVIEVMLAHAILQDMEGTEGMQIQMTRLNGGVSPVETLGLIINNRDALPFEALMSLGIGQVLSRLDESWKRKTIIRSDAVSDLVAATIHFSDQREWLVIQERLKRVPTIREFEILALSTKGAEIMLHFVGSFTQLRVSMAQQDLELLDNDRVTSIGLRSGMEAFPELGVEETTDIIGTDSNQNEVSDMNVMDLYSEGASNSDDATTNDW